ncbi:hypothetical protein BN988_02190 [Oceanobacillus picturae]|uniref:Uncharacterized protein n=1 Tax=Oceanobacillus picturae TaxID=171693 RepID=W9ALA9_9BACI|nr:hypothetical protein [Oceanobacillus picturae]CDO03672.1 hypothetical protein BN988_02190 [Oceanobacillus picturae]
MEIYLYSNDFSEQSIRQMKTIISFLDCKKIFLNEQWGNYLNNSTEIDYLDFQKFVDRKGSKVIIYFNIIDGYNLKKYKSFDNLLLVFRPRGILPEESYYKNNSILKKTILNFIESKVIKSTDYFIFLNNEQKQHFLLKYSKHEQKILRARILPNVKLMNEVSTNSNLNYASSKVKLLYSGGFSKWQNINLVFKVVSDIIIQSGIKCEFTVLTFEGNFERAKDLARKYNITDQMILKYISPNKLDDELRNYDIGIIIRDNNLVNITASPFKVIDYISNGLGIILTDNIAGEVRNILPENFLFQIGLREKELFYSNQDLNMFVSNMVGGKNKEDILNSYKLYVSSISKIDCEKDFVTKVGEKWLD